MGDWSVLLTAALSGRLLDSPKVGKLEQPTGSPMEAPLVDLKAPQWEETMAKMMVH